MDIVAEGVETKTQLDTLAALNCDQAAGIPVEQPVAPPQPFNQFLSSVGSSPMAKVSGRRQLGDGGGDERIRNV